MALVRYINNASQKFMFLIDPYLILDLEDINLSRDGTHFSEI